MSNLINIGIISGVIVAAIIILGIIVSRLYKKSSKEQTFVRTGFGGEKVIMNGGAISNTKAIIEICFKKLEK